jgi:hypothetical protein
MSPILGALGGVKAYGFGSGGNTSFESIATTTAAGGEAFLTFTSIPSTYKSLQIRGIARDGYTTNLLDGGLYIKINGDTGANYSYHWVYGNGTSVGVNGVASYATPYIVLGDITSGLSNTNIYAVSIWDFVDYAATTKYKTVRTISGSNTNGTGSNIGIAISSILWQSTSAINQIGIGAGQTNFAAGSTFALYGIKG